MLPMVLISSLLIRCTSQLDYCDVDDLRRYGALSASAWDACLYSIAVAALLLLLRSMVLRLPVSCIGIWRWKLPANSNDNN